MLLLCSLWVHHEKCIVICIKNVSQWSNLVTFQTYNLMRISFCYIHCLCISNTLRMQFYPLYILFILSFKAFVPIKHILWLKFPSFVNDTVFFYECSLKAWDGSVFLSHHGRIHADFFSKVENSSKNQWFKSDYAYQGLLFEEWEVRLLQSVTK